MVRQQISTGQRTFRLLGLLIIAGLLVAVWKHQAIYDQYRLHNYTPAPTIAQLADDTTMTPAARHLYYINHPLLKPKDSFSNFCPSGTEQSVVLGCYKSGEQGIYVLQVDKTELHGIEQVTAAHEMLHAAYQRLSTKQRRQVNAELLDFYEHQLTDPAIKQTMDDYKKTEPNDLVNEMHSIFGTEVADLPPSLSNYYTRYFTNRSTVTGYYQAYQQAFTDRQTQIKSYDSQLNTQKGQIDQLQNSVTNQQTSLQAQRTTLDGYRQNDQTGQYNSGVSSYNAAVRTYNSDVTRLQSLIASYNQLVAKRNSIAFEERQLTDSISAPASTR